MGNSPLVNLTADAESPTDPGKLCVLSDEIKVEDYDAFYDEVVEYCKYLVDNNMETVLKEVKVQEIGPDEFSAMVILDGSKLTSYGYGNKEHPDMDAVVSLNKFKMDKAGRTIKSWLYGPAEGLFWMNELDKWDNCDKSKAKLISTTHFLKDPLRIEYYWETTDNAPQGLPVNSRIANDVAKAVLSPIIETVVSKFANLKVKNTFDSPSVATPGEKSVISNTLSEDEVSFTALVDGLVEILKANTDSAEIGTVVKVVEVSETMFTKTFGEDLVRTFEVDKEKGAIKVESKLKTKSTGVTEHYVVNKSPLQFEAWSINDGKRQTGKAFSRQCERLWNEAYSKAVGGGSWFSW